MRRLAAAGDRAGAIRAYERLSHRLRDELRIAPSLTTRELADALRRRRPSSAASEVPVAYRGAGRRGRDVAVHRPGGLDRACSDELGDDEAEGLRRVHFGLLRDVVTAHGGQEVKNLGDGLIVAFPSAVNAVSCAIGIQQAVHRHNARQGDDRLQVRVGTERRRADPRRGRLFRHAGRRRQAAVRHRRGWTDPRVWSWCGASWARAGTFTFRLCGQTALKGISEPLETWEVAWEPVVERRIGLPDQLLPDKSAPFVGRDAPLQELRSHWQAALAGGRRVAMLVGEPGIGKTRLAAEFCRSAHKEGALVLLGRCYEESLVPYQAFVEACATTCPRARWTS